MNFGMEFEDTGTEIRTRFCVIKTDYNEREAEWRIFGEVKKNVIEYPENTMLQKR